MVFYCTNRRYAIGPTDYPQPQTLYTITASNTSGSSTATVYITIFNDSPRLSYGSGGRKSCDDTIGVVKGRYFQEFCTHLGIPDSYTFIENSPPDGLSLDATTGKLAEYFIVCHYFCCIYY